MKLVFGQLITHNKMKLVHFYLFRCAAFVTIATTVTIRVITSTHDQLSSNSCDL